MAIFSRVDLEAQSRIDDEISRHRAIIRDLCARRNTHSAVMKFPNEILSRIFTEYKTIVDASGLKTRTTTEYLLLLLNLTRVCSRWRQVAVDTASVWSTITLDRPRWAAESLKRSKRSPLTVLGSLGNVCPPKSPEDLLPVIMQAATRFQDVDIRLIVAERYHTDIPDFLFDSSLKFAAPLLQTLRIDYNTQDDDSAYGSIDGYEPDYDYLPIALPFSWSELTSLWSLTLRNFIPTRLASMPSLTDLVIELEGNHFDDIRRLTVRRVLNVLRNAPALESVTLSPLSSPDDPADTLPDDSPPIPLPNLEELNLTSVHIKESILFSHLDIPALQYASIVYLNGNDPHTVTLVNSDLTHIHHQISRSIPSDIDALAVSVKMGKQTTSRRTYIGSYEEKDNRYELVVREDQDRSDPIFELSFSVFPSVEHCISTVNSLPLGRITNLHLTRIEKDDEALAWSQVIPHLVRLKNLWVEKIQVLSMLGSAPSLNDVVDSNSVTNPELDKVTLDSEDPPSTEDLETLKTICCFRHDRNHPLGRLLLYCHVGPGRRQYEKQLWGYKTNVVWMVIRDSEEPEEFDDFTLWD